MIRQVSAKPRYFLEIPGSQGKALWRENCASDGNDTQIQATYSAREVAIFLEEAGTRSDKTT
jgi:hypothetical protein